MYSFIRLAVVKSRFSAKYRRGDNTWLPWKRNVALNVADVDSIQVIYIEATLTKCKMWLFVVYVDLLIFDDVT